MIVAPYIRVSTQEQAINGNSISEQTERLKAYCAAMDWTIYDLYVDAGFSGSNTNRPALQKLLKAVREHHVSKVVVYKLDRLSRSQKDTLELIEDEFISNSVDFVSMSENFDTSTPFGKAMIGILAVFAQLEREQIKERMTMGKVARAKDGLFRGAWNVPIGYDYERNSGLTINEYEALQVRKVFELYLAGTGKSRIAATLNESGFKHKYGEWSDLTVHNVLKSQYYIGNVIYKGIWYPGKHEPIISAEEFEEAQSLLEERRSEYFLNHRESRVASYLGGLLTCKHCGGKYNKITSKYGKYYYCNSRSKHSAKQIKDPNCKNKNWKMSELDNIVFDQIKKIAIKPETRESPVQNDTAAIASHIREIEKQSERLLELYAIDGIPMDVLSERISKLNNEKIALEAELERIQDNEKRTMSAEESQRLAASFDSVLEHGSFEDIRAVITALISEIVLDEDDVEIHWKF